MIEVILNLFGFGRYIVFEIQRSQNGEVNFIVTRGAVWRQDYQPLGRAWKKPPELARRAIFDRRDGSFVFD